MSKTIDEEQPKTTLVEYKLDEIVKKHWPRTVLYPTKPISPDRLAKATKSIQKLIDDECIKAREDELKHLLMNYWQEDGDFIPCKDIEARIDELRATESPLKSVKEDI